MRVVSLPSEKVPAQMVSQTWDDHDRSDRYTCRDFGQNYLNSVPEKGNPILFTRTLGADALYQLQNIRHVLRM